jgi:hypothetical protein
MNSGTDVPTIVLPEVLPEQGTFKSRHRRSQSNMSSPTEAGRDLDDLLGHRIVVEEVLTDPHFEVVSIHKEKKQRWLDHAGRGVSFFFAIGCGVTAAAALATLVSGPLFFVLAGILCLSTTYANYRMTNHDVSNIFVGGIKGIFQKRVVVETEGDAESADNSAPYLSPSRMLVLGGGVVLSLSFGMVFGALTYGSTIGLASAFGFLGAISVALPPIGIVLGALTFICLSCLMIKAFSDLVKTEYMKEKIKNKIINIFPQPKPNQSREVLYLKRALVGLAAFTLVAGTLGLIIWGQISTLMNCAREFGKILTNISSASSAVVNIVSNVIGVGCALVAQIPFILKTSVQPIFKLFTRKTPGVDETPFESTLGEKAKSVLLVVTSAFSAAATGAIALAGKTIAILPLLAGAGAFLNNFLGSVVNAVISQPLPAPPKKEVNLTIDTNKQAGSTREINDTLAETEQQAKFNQYFVFERSPLSATFYENYFNLKSPPNATATPAAAAANDATVEEQRKSFSM